MINIPHNRAIELLEKRLVELDLPGTDLTAFKNRLKLDAEGIFGLRSTQSISTITLDTLHFGDPQKITQFKTTFRQTIQGWINYIKDFHIIEQEKIELSEQKYKEKYETLLAKWNDLVPEYNDLLTNHESLIQKYDDALAEINTLQKKMSEKQPLGEVIKILFLAASPLDEDRLRIDQELRDIEDGLKAATLREQFELKSKLAITTQHLRQTMLEENPSIVHFSGHGNTSGIVIEDTHGNSRLIDNDAIGSLFELFSEETKCVVLNSCYSESQAIEISKHIPYVVGMKSSVSDDAAIAFAVGFYAALGAGRDIEFAFKWGTVAIKLEGITGSDLPILLK